MFHRGVASPPPPEMTADGLLLNPQTLGERMGRRDPHYKPCQGSRNPFTALSQFRGAKKLLPGAKEGGGWSEGDLFSSCFELPSSFFEALAAADADARSQPIRAQRPAPLAHSLPASPTAARRIFSAAQARQAAEAPADASTRKTSQSLYSHPLFAGECRSCDIPKYYPSDLGLLNGCGRAEQLTLFAFFIYPW
jgi:hypothetical protein